MGYQVWIVGTGGSVQLTFDDATFYYEEEKPNSAVPRDRTPPPESVLDEGVTTGPTNSATSRGDRPYRGEGAKVEVEGASMSAGLLAAGNFIDSVRDGERPWTDEWVGWGSAVPVIFGDEASRKGGRVEFAQHLPAAPATR